MRDAGDALEMFTVGAIVGAGLMFLLDPKVGRARRNYLRDKLIHGINQKRKQTSRFIRDKRNRARGVIAQAFKNQEWARRASDATSPSLQRLEERVRA